MTDILDDAKVYSSHANKKNIDVEDIKLAIQCRLDHSFTTPPPRDVYILIPFLSLVLNAAIELPFLTCFLYNFVCQLTSRYQVPVAVLFQD